MSVAPSDFLESARKIDLNGLEIGRRNCLSRAYYAAMHETKSIVPASLMKSEFKGNSHEEIIVGVKALSRQLVPGRTDAAVIAGELAALKGARVLADYRLLVNIEKPNAELGLIRAEKIFAACARIRILREKTGHLPPV